MASVTTLFAIDEVGRRAKIQQLLNVILVVVVELCVFQINIRVHAVAIPHGIGQSIAQYLST